MTGTFGAKHGVARSAGVLGVADSSPELARRHQDKDEEQGGLQTPQHSGNSRSQRQIGKLEVKLVRGLLDEAGELSLQPA